MGSARQRQPEHYSPSKQEKFYEGEHSTKEESAKKEFFECVGSSYATTLFLATSANPFLLNIPFLQSILRVLLNLQSITFAEIFYKTGKYRPSQSSENKISK